MTPGAARRLALPGGYKYFTPTGFRSGLRLVIGFIEKAAGRFMLQFPRSGYSCWAASHVMPAKTLKERIGDWTDWDGAAYSLGICIGLMPDVGGFGAAKHVFWSNHPIGDLLYSMLDRMVEQGILEKRDEPDTQYRWSPTFHGSWEGPT